MHRRLDLRIRTQLDARESRPPEWIGHAPPHALRCESLPYELDSFNPARASEKDRVDLAVHGPERALVGDLQLSRRLVPDRDPQSIVFQGDADDLARAPAFEVAGIGLELGRGQLGRLLVGARGSRRQELLEPRPEHRGAAQLLQGRFADGTALERHACQIEIVLLDRQAEDLLPVVGTGAHQKARHLDMVVENRHVERANVVEGVDRVDLGPLLEQISSDLQVAPSSGHGERRRVVPVGGVDRHAGLDELLDRL